MIGALIFIAVIAGQGVGIAIWAVRDNRKRL
jgi:hypothetical protein